MKEVITQSPAGHEAYDLTTMTASNPTTTASEIINAWQGTTQQSVNRKWKML